LGLFHGVDRSGHSLDWEPGRGRDRQPTAVNTFG
jgi:hypothetical protein